MNLPKEIEIKQISINEIYIIFFKRKKIYFFQNSSISSYKYLLKVEKGQIKFPSSNPTPPFSYGNGISRWTNPNYFLAGYFVGKGK